MCATPERLSNERQFGIALQVYATDRYGLFPIGGEGVDSKGNPNPYWVQTLAPYYSQTQDARNSPAWKDPGRDWNPDYLDWYPWGDGQYRAVGAGPSSPGAWGLVDARYWSNTSISDVDVPTKTVWLHCALVGANFSHSVHTELIGIDPDGIHLGSDNYLFVDGHAASYSPDPITDTWLNFSQRIYHYPPNLPPDQAEW